MCRKAYVACNFNYLFENEKPLKVTANYVHVKCGNNSEIVPDGIVVTAGRLARCLSLLLANYRVLVLPTHRRIITDSVSREAKANGSVRPSVCLFPLYLLNRLTFALEFFVCVGHDHSSPGTKSQGHKLRSDMSSAYGRG